VATYDAVMGIGPMETVSTDSSRPSFMTGLGVTSVGVCYSAIEGEWQADGGRVDLGGGVPGLDYKWAAAVGTQHWGVLLDNFIVAGDGQSDQIQTTTCSSTSPCAGIVDSGTSLIGVPTSLLEELSPVLNLVASDCSNLHELPSIRIGSGEHSFEMPAAAWVVKMTDVPETTEMPLDPWGIFTIPVYTGRMTDECTHAFMAMDEMTDKGPMIILGAAFLRTYAVIFDRTDPSARRMGYARVPEGSDICAGCSATSASDSLAASTAALEPPALGETNARAVHAKPSGVSMSTLRFPTWLGRLRGKNNESVVLPL